MKYRLCAFADEADPMLTGQMEAMQRNGISLLEIRGVDRENISALTPAKVKDVAHRLSENGLAVWSIGSPTGKIKLTDDWQAHMDSFRGMLDAAATFGAGAFRMFSFYEAQNEKNEVIDRMGKMLDVAEEYGVDLCHENEKGIWGDTPERCRELLDTFEGRLSCVFDPANFIQCGCQPFEHSYNLLKTYITYMHIKDAVKNGTVVPAGRGIGTIPELLAIINREFSGEMILTLEPHLRVFAGLDALEGEHKTSLGNTFKTSAEAFEAAVTNLRYCVPRTAQVL